MLFRSCLETYISRVICIQVDDRSASAPVQHTTTLDWRPMRLARNEVRSATPRRSRDAQADPDPASGNEALRKAASSSALLRLYPEGSDLYRRDEHIACETT